MPKTSVKWNRLQLSVDSYVSYEKQFHSGTKNVNRKMNTKNIPPVKVKHSVMSVLSNCSDPDTLLTCFMSPDFY